MQDETSKANGSLQIQSFILFHVMFTYNLGIRYFIFYYLLLFAHHFIFCCVYSTYWFTATFLSVLGPPQEFWGAGENGHLFSGSWGALAIIFRELGRKIFILGSLEALSECDLT